MPVLILSLPIAIAAAMVAASMGMNALGILGAYSIAGVISISTLAALRALQSQDDFGGRW